MTTQELKMVNKDTQRFILKILSESPALKLEELYLHIKNSNKNITQEEITQVIHGIAPTKNWQKLSEEEVQNELLKYVWTLETQILSLFPVKQKETSVAEFNQMRLQNNQPKVSKDLIRHIQSLLMVEAKNLSRFRKFQKDHLFQDDVDPNAQAMWATRLIISSIKAESISSVNELSSLLISQLKEKFPEPSNKVGKTLQRICERFTEKYFPKSISDTKLKELISSYQETYNTYKKMSEGEIATNPEVQDQNKAIKSIIEKLQNIQTEVKESHEGGFLSKLFSGQVKNREGIIQKINEVISSLNDVTEQSNKASKANNEKLLTVQKLQSDYEALVLLKAQSENDLHGINEKLNTSEERNTSLTKELHLTTESLEKAHEKIADLQQKLETASSQTEKSDSLKQELSTAKDISLKLYTRINKLKADLLKQDKSEKLKGFKPSDEASANGNHSALNNSQG